MESTPKAPNTSPPKPKNKNLIMVGIVIVVLIVVGVGVWAYVNSGGSGPTGTKFVMWDSGTVCSTAAQCGFKDNTGNINATISVGTTIYWANTGKASHSATSCDPTTASTDGTAACPATNSPGTLPAFDTTVIAAGQNSKSVTFSTAGTYYYFCTVHTFMHAKIVVQ